MMTLPDSRAGDRRTQEETVSDTEPTSGAPAQQTAVLADTLRTVVIAACVGAAAIHFAYAPAHFDHETAHGLFFLAAAWAQVGAAVALARWRERPAGWWAAVGVNAAIVAVWVVSRTAGVPGYDAESIGLADAVATALALGAVAGSLAALRVPAVRRSASRVPALAGGAAAAVLVVAVSASVTPSIAGSQGADRHGHAAGEIAAADGHASGDHDDGHDAHGEAHEVGAVDHVDRCDLGFNTPAFNEVSEPGVSHVHDDTGGVDFTIEEWAEVFVDESRGIPAAAVVSYLEDNPNLRDGVLSGGLTHTLDPDPWNPMTEESECQALAAELARAREVAARYPTIADAEAAGYRRVTNYYPGIAAHFMKFDLVDSEFVIEEPEMLLYDGDGDHASIVGLSYYVIEQGDEPPTVGFTGDNDHWHRHVGLCIVDGVVAGGSNTSEEDCEAAGGRKADGTAAWMNHVWIVPGCESDWGLFSGANPTLTVRGLDNTGEMPSGCGTGKAVGDPLDFDDPGGGPSI
jgi:hypothetical protein